MTREPLSNGKSASSRHPRLPSNTFARSTPETGMSTTASFRSTSLTLAIPLASSLRTPVVLIAAS
jgi:hypothetical protein